jgi:polysaccharide export outer membrane protein
MRHQTISLIIILLLLASCTSQKKLAYLNNLPEVNGEESFIMDVPDYKLQPRDILYITAKAMNAEGKIEDFLSSPGGGLNVQTSTGEGAGGFLYGYDVNQEGTVRIPVVGTIKVEGLTLEEARNLIQTYIDKVYKNSTVECKLLSFKYTVIGEVRAPATYINYNNYLTVLEAIGRAGGVGDFGNRDRVLVVRATDRGSKTFRLNLQDKSILASEAYFLLPNDVVIVEPMPQKIFNLNLPTISFFISTTLLTITTTLLFINYFQ